MGDLIAIPPRGVRYSFDGVNTDYETAIHWVDYHLAANYLKTKELAQVLRTSLGQP